MSTAAFSATTAVLAVFLAGCAGYKVWQYRRARTAGAAVTTYALVTCLGALAVALALQSPLAETALDAALGASATSLALAPSLAIIASCGYQCFAVSINDPYSAQQRIRWRVSLAALAVIILVVTFIVSPDGLPALRELDPVSYRSDPFGAVIFLTYVGYLGLAAADVARLAYRFTRLGNVPLLRLGLLMVTGGAYIVGAYAIVKLTAFVAGVIVDRNLDPIALHATRPLVIAGALLTGIGNTLPSWGRWVGVRKPAEWLGLYISYLALRPLWKALVGMRPQIALEPRSRWADLLPDDLRFRATRRVVEIRDGLLLLRPYRTAEAAARATHLARERGLQGEELTAAAEAADIALALRAAATDAGPSAAAPSGIVIGTFDVGTANMTEEVHWLVRVTHAFRHSPVVRDALAGHAESATASAPAGPDQTQPSASPPSTPRPADAQCRPGTGILDR